PIWNRGQKPGEPQKRKHHPGGQERLRAFGGRGAQNATGHQKGGRTDGGQFGPHLSCRPYAAPGLEGDPGLSGGDRPGTVSDPPRGKLARRVDALVVKSAFSPKEIAPYFPK